MIFLQNIIKLPQDQLELDAQGSTQVYYYMPQ